MLSLIWCVCSTVYSIWYFIRSYIKVDDNAARESRTSKVCFLLIPVLKIHFLNLNFFVCVNFWFNISNQTLICPLVQWNGLEIASKRRPRTIVEKLQLRSLRPTSRRRENRRRYMWEKTRNATKIFMVNILAKIAYIYASWNT